MCSNLRYVAAGDCRNLAYLAAFSIWLYNYLLLLVNNKHTVIGSPSTNTLILRNIGNKFYAVSSFGGLNPATASRFVPCPWTLFLNLLLARLFDRAISYICCSLVPYVFTQATTMLASSLFVLIGMCPNCIPRCIPRWQTHMIKGTHKNTRNARESASSLHKHNFSTFNRL